MNSQTGTFSPMRINQSFAVSPSKSTGKNSLQFKIENEDYTDQSQKSPDITPSKTENIMQEQKMTFSNHVNFNG